MKLVAILAVFSGLICVPQLYADWTDNGIPVCTASGMQDYPVITSDGSGGAIIAWRDSRPAVNTDIYAQGISAAGNIRWFETGMPVCTASNSQSTPIIIADSSGGAIIAWQDSRTGGSLDIYVQKLNSDGYIQWTGNGVPICTGQTSVVLGHMVSDGDGGAIITWQDRRNFYNDIFAQRVGSDGTIQWAANGVAVCTAIMHQENPSISYDGAGGAIIAWQDDRNNMDDIYAQRLDASGSAQWTPDGIVIYENEQQQRYPQLIEDGSGGAIIAWADRRNTIDFDIFAQRVDANGNLLWGTSGSAVSARMYNQMDCRLVHMGSGEAIVTWIDYRSVSSSDVYAQKINASGVAQWTPNGVAVCGATGDQLNAQIISNGSGGAFITWDDQRNGTDNVDVFAQNINADGTAAWTANGEVICGAAGNQRTPQLTTDGSNGTVIAWADNRGGTYKVYCHRVNAAGDIPTPTLLSHYSVAASGPDIRIDWTLSDIDDGIEFLILRASEPSMTFEEIPSNDLIRDGLSFSFIDKSVEPGVIYYYRVDIHDGSERKNLFETGPINTLFIDITLYQNYPNPFNPRTIIRYFLPEPCYVKIEVFDMVGNRVTVLMDKAQASGSHRVDWNGHDANGYAVASGVYFYRLTAGKKTLSKKMILLK